MEGRKLTLVPYKRWMEYHRWQEQRTPQLPPNPHLTEMSQLQHELQSLMNRSDLSETEKSQRYGQLLQRLQLFHQKALDETAVPSLKDLKALMKSPSPPPPPPLTSVVKTEATPRIPEEEKVREVFQTPSAASLPSKIATSLLTPSPTPQREEFKAWVKKRMSTPSSTEVKKKEGKPEVKKDKKTKEIPLPPPTPLPKLPSTSTPVAHRTRKAVSKPPSRSIANSVSEDWITY
jgi:hypothetical protein